MAGKSSQLKAKSLSKFTESLLVNFIRIKKMAKCGNCNAVINPRWESCLVCDSPVNATITVEPEKEQKAEKLDRELEQDAIPIKDKGEQIISLHTKIAR